jgi:hypothetical protein
VFTGTDSVTAWAQLLYISTGGIVLALVIYRAVASTKKKRGPARTPGHVPVRALSWGAAALGITALVTFASGLGPFRWFESGGSTTATVPLSVQANSAPASEPTADGGQAQGSDEYESHDGEDDDHAFATGDSQASAENRDNNHGDSHDSHHGDSHGHDDDHDD